MASISYDKKTGHRRIQFSHPTRGRQTLRLGKVSKQVAGEINVYVERMLVALNSARPVDPDTERWTSKLTPAFYARLVRVGLVTPQVKAAEKHDLRLGNYLRQQLEARSHLKPNTRRNLSQAAGRLTQWFGENRAIDTITEGHADDWVRWLQTKGYRSKGKTERSDTPKPRGLSVATVSRDVKRAKEFFRSAVRHRILASNPFSDLKTGPQSNSSREFFVTRGMIEAALAACPDVGWRAIIALSRFGGLRCPSEHLLLTWQDIDWERGRVKVTSPKTARYPDGGFREVPLFPELRNVLAEAFEQAKPGSVYVIERYRTSDQNLRTHFLRILRKAGVSPWPRLFHNLRGSRETELARDYPLHVACKWLGNSPKVAQKHYLQLVQEDFDKATQKATHQVPDSSCTEQHAAPVTVVSAAFTEETQKPIPSTGIEPVTFNFGG